MSCVDFVEVIIPVVEEIKFEKDRIEALKDLKEFIEVSDLGIDLSFHWLIDISE